MRLRKSARELVSKLQTYLETYSVTVENGIIYIDDSLYIDIMPRRLRILDTVWVVKDDMVLWLPLLQRLRLRRSVRAFMLNRALVELHE